MNNRILAMLLAIIMVVSMVPVNAFAAQQTHACVDNLGTTRTSENNGKHYAICVYTDSKDQQCGEKVYFDCTFGSDYTCDYCGYEKPHEHVDTANGGNGTCDVEGCSEHVHKIGTVAAKEPNCTEQGNYAYRKCEFCNVVFKGETGLEVGRESDYIRNVVHKGLTNHEAKAPTCTETGLVAFTYCSLCGKYFSDAEAKNEIPEAQIYVSATNHKLKKVAKVEKTCETQGNIEYYECETCGKYFEDDKATKEITNKDAVKYPLPLADHTWSNWEGEDATGHMKTCTVCGTTNTKRAHANFSYENGKQICGDCGYEFDHICVDTYAGGNHKCDACSAELEHDVHWNSNGSGKHYTTCEDAKCFKAGTTLTGWEDCVDADKDCVCDDCGFEFEHDWSEGLSFTEEGHFRVCTVCGEENTLYEHDLSYGSAQANDDKTHTRTCKHEDCNYQVTEDHNDGSLIDHICGSCNGEMAHNWKWDYGTVSHRRVCEVCGKATEYVAHSIKEGDCQCECGYGMPHSWSTEIHFTEEGHFNVCTNCGAESEKMAHDLSFGSAKANDNQTHTKTCKLKGCEYKVTEAHNDGTNSDHKCGACRAEMVHDWEWDYGPTSHREKCKVCGKLTAYEPHVDEEAPFCKCDDCGAELTHGRKYVEWLEPDCVNDGHTDYYECEKCGLKYLSDGKETDPTIPKLGHDWGTVKSMSSSTYCGDLNHFKSCLRGNCDEVEIIPCVDANEDCVCDLSGKLLHSHKLVKNPGQEATCTEDGYEEYYTYFGCGKLVEDKVIIPATGHDEDSEWTVLDAENHVQKCADCDAVLNTAAHVYNDFILGCDVCGAREDLVEVPAVEPTCTTSGNIRYWRSTKNDGRSYYDMFGIRLIRDMSKVVKPATGHDMSDWQAMANGIAHEKVCENEGCTYKESNFNHTNANGDCFCDDCGAVLNGHVHETISYVAPTCTKPGQAAAVFCKACNKNYDVVTHEVLTTTRLEPIGHQWEAEWFNDAREHGHSKYCERRGCNEKLTVEHTLEIEDTLKGNVHQWFCTSCDYIETGIHVNKDGDTLCDECGHNSSTVVTENSLNNNKQNVTVKVEKVEDEKDALSTWFDNFVGKFNPSSSGESNSSSAPSASVGSSVPSSGSGNGSGTSSGSTASGSGNTSSSTGSSAINGLIQWLASLLNALLGA